MDARVSRCLRHTQPVGQLILTRDQRYGSHPRSGTSRSSQCRLRGVDRRHAGRYVQPTGGWRWWRFLIFRRWLTVMIIYQRQQHADCTPRVSTRRY